MIERYKVKEKNENMGSVWSIYSVEAEGVCEKCSRHKLINHVIIWKKNLIVMGDKNVVKKL